MEGEDGDAILCVVQAIVAAERGKGIGKAMLSKLEEIVCQQIRDKGAEGGAIYLNSLAGAIGFYEKQGFEKLDDSFNFMMEELPKLRGGVQLMAKKVAS